MKKLLAWVRKQYDKILHITTCALIVVVLSRLISSGVVLVMLAVSCGVVWEFINFEMLDIEKSGKDMLANFIGALLGLGVLWWI